jgi:hypothetical protein
VGVTAAEAAPTPTFAQINVGGLRPTARRRQRGQLPAAGRDRGDAPAAAQLLGPGQQEEPRPLHQARGAHHPHRLRPALGLQPDLIVQELVRMGKSLSTRAGRLVAAAWRWARSARKPTS